MRVLTQTYGIVAAILEKDGKFLLVQEAKLPDKGKWNHPAGWIEVGENPVDGVKREVKEETGFDFEPDGILGIYSFVKKRPRITAHPIKIVFTGSLGKRSQKLAEDVLGTKWFTAQEIYEMDHATLRDEDIKQMVKDYLSGRRFDLSLLMHSEHQSL